MLTIEKIIHAAPDLIPFMMIYNIDSLTNSSRPDSHSSKEMSTKKNLIKLEAYTTELATDIVFTCAALVAIFKDIPGLIFSGALIYAVARLGMSMSMRNQIDDLSSS